MTVPMRIAVSRVLAVRRSCWCRAALRPLRADATRPAVGPERPFQLAPRVERTLPNGLRVIVTRQTAVPKVSVTLTVLSGYSSDPADHDRARAVDRGRRSRKARRRRTAARFAARCSAMGGSLTAAASQDFTSISARGLVGVRAAADRPRRRRGDEPDVAGRRDRDPEAAAPAGRAAAEGVAAVSGEPRRSGARCSAIIRTRAPARREASLQAIDRAKIDAFHRDALPAEQRVPAGRRRRRARAR